MNFNAPDTSTQDDPIFDDADFDNEGPSDADENEEDSENE